MRTLLEKCRLISKTIQRAAGHPVDFEEMAKVLSENIE
ncbi:MAG TPA: GTP-sensing pleiotropic transcriptional regulator CodY, partial [Verrucomicrobiae bacterium]|nr:GTP-sensing pleiotropic transcriptional regulator CodY [Verrucomicrobiae bacterium]